MGALVSILESSSTDKDKFREGLYLETFVDNGSKKGKGRQGVGAAD